MTFGKEVSEAVCRKLEMPRYDNTNCVIASLQSAFHAPATHEERVLRERLSKEKEEKLRPFLHLASTQDGLKQLRKANMILETRSISTFIKRISRSRTPLGRVLSRYEFEERVISAAELEEITDGQRIVLIADTMTPYNREWHMMHVRKLPSGKLVSGNDNDQEIILHPEAKYMTFLFIMKQ